MIRIKPEQDVTNIKVGVFRVYHLFKSDIFHIILSECVCVRACVRVCACTCIVDVMVSPIYFCIGFAVWIILFEETPHRKLT